MTPLPQAHVRSINRGGDATTPTDEVEGDPVGAQEPALHADQLLDVGGGEASASAPSSSGQAGCAGPTVSGLPRDFVTVETAAAQARVNPKTLYGAIAARTVAGVLRVGLRTLRVAPALMMGGPRPTVMPGDPDDITMTADELVEYLLVDVKTIYGAVERGELPATRLGSVLRFSRARLLWSTTRGQVRGARKIGSRK